MNDLLITVNVCFDVMLPFAAAADYSERYREAGEWSFVVYEVMLMCICLAA